jgi:hypothetical protein
LRTIVLALSVLLAALTTFASTDLPFTYFNGQIWLRCTTPGSPQPLYFILDSGATRSALSTRAAAALGLTPGRPEILAGIQGPYTASRIAPTPIFKQNIQLTTALIQIDTGRLTTQLGHQLDGIIGVDFFYHHSVQIDYKAQLLHIYEPGKQNFFPADACDLAIRNGALCIQASVNGNSPTWFRLDTGCGSALEWCETNGANISQSSPFPQNPATPSPNNASSFRSLEKVDLTIGPRQFPHVEAGLHPQPLFPGESGLIGNALLSHCVITIDAPEKRLYIADPN